jgi:hypothetical protein
MHSITAAQAQKVLVSMMVGVLSTAAAVLTDEEREGKEEREEPE